MMDYPIFLGDAIFLALNGFRMTSFLGVRALDIVRIGASITLLWASIEKWAYPEWTYPNPVRASGSFHGPRSAFLYDCGRYG